MTASASLATALPGAVTTDMLVVFGLVLFALVLFSIERVPVDLTAILLMVLLIVLGDWTQIDPTEGISGFSNKATITVLAMLILSAGISRTGLVQRLGAWIASVAGENDFKQLGAVLAVAGPSSALINNTPVVAVLVPVVSDLAHKGKTSPSKLLIPLSFVSMLGGTLTLIGTSTNILASDVAARLGAEHPATDLHGFSMFEFTHLGAIVLAVGAAYLLFVAYRLLPERIEPREDFIEEYRLQDYLTEVTVRPDSPLIGKTVEEGLGDREFDIDVLQIDRGGEQFLEPLAQKEIRAGDVFTVRTDRETLARVMDVDDLGLADETVTEAELEAAGEGQTLVEIIVPSGSTLVGTTLASSAFRQRYDATVLAVRSHGALQRRRIDELEIRVGDTLLVQAPADSIDRLSRNREFIVAHEPPKPDYRTEKVPHALAIMLGVVALPVLGLLPIHVSALAGVAAMSVTGVLKPTELYDAVDWSVIFLLAGVIPLGMALEQTGAAALVGEAVASTASVLPAVAVLWVFYVATALLTNVVSNNASVVVMLPVAVQAAIQLQVSAFAFVLAVTFAASTAFMTPIGYQTNLFVYGPGGYTFRDFLTVGGPLQLLLSVVTTVGIAVFWPL